MKRRLLALVMLAAASAAAAPAYAQLAQPKTRSSRPVRGLFGNGTGDTGQQLVLNVSFGAGYDKDEGGTASGGPGGPPIVYPDRSGSYGTGSVSLDYNLSWEKITAGASIGSNARFQPNQAEELTQSAGASAFVTAQLSKNTSLSASQGISRQPHNLQLLFGSWQSAGSPQEVLMDLSGTTAPGNFLSSNSSVSFSQGITQRISLTANYSYHQHGGWFAGPASQSSTQTASAGVSYAIFSFARVRIAYGTTTTRFGSMSTRTSYGGPMADSGLDFGRAISLSRRMTFTFSTGVAGARDEGGGLRYLATGHAAVSYELGRSWTADANVRRGVDFNQGFLQPVVLDTVSFGVSGDLGRRVQVNAGGGIAFGDIGVGTPGGGYDVSTARISARTALTRTLGVSVQYGYRHYQFDDPASLPVGLRPTSDRHTVRASLDLWVPLITRARRANASGKTYKPEEFLRIFRKRIWLIVVPWGIVAAATAGAVRFLPDQYQASALIQMVPPKVPDSIMRTSTSASMQDRLRATQEVILSRTRLERLVKEFNLYPEKQKTQIMEDIVTDMRRDVVVAQAKGDTFRVRYVGSDPLTVFKVTERLASYFITESLMESQRRAEGTSAYVEGEVEEKKRQLIDTEERLAKYKMANAAELPSQVGSNQQAIQSIQNQLSQIAMTQTADQTRRRDVERMIESLEKADSSTAAVPVPAPTTDLTTFTGPASQKLVLARNQLNQIIAQGLKPDHVRYQAAERQVRLAEKEAEAEALRSPVSSATAGMSRAEITRLQQLEGYRTELDTLKSNMAQREATEKALRAKAADYQTKIDRAPIHDAALTELTREYGTISGIYNGLVGKREAASSAVNLERRQIGEQFNLLDPATLPQKPFSPDRLVYNIFGLAAGLALGVALVVLLEYRDTSFKTDSELSSVLGLPVLAVVPLMQSDAESRSRFRRRLLMNLGFGSTAAVCFAIVAYAFVFLR